jgi:transposase
MDTCSRLEEPGGVGWKDVNVGRLRTSTGGKRLIWSHSSGRSIGSVAKELGLRDSVLRRWVEQRGTRREPMAASRRSTTQATLPSADHAAEIARLQRENERLRMERDILKKSIAIFAGVQK